MQFVTLPEPHIGCRNVMAHAPLLYRLDARSPTSSIVVTEYGGEKRLPFIETSGSETRRLFDRVLGMLEYSVLKPNIALAPLYTLDLQPSPGRQALVTGFSDGRVRVVTYGDEYWLTELERDMWSVRARLRELGRLYYGA